MESLDLLHLEEKEQFEWIQGLQHLQRNSSKEGNEHLSDQIKLAKDAFAQQIDGTDPLPTHIIEEVTSRMDVSIPIAIESVPINLDDIYGNCSSPMIEEKDFITLNDSPEIKSNAIRSGFGGNRQIEFIANHSNFSRNYSLQGVKRLNPLLYPDSSMTMASDFDATNTSSTEYSGKTITEALSFGSTSSHPVINPHCHCFHCLKQKELYDESLRASTITEETKYSMYFSSDSEDDQIGKSAKIQEKSSKQNYYPHAGQFSATVSSSSSSSNSNYFPCPNSGLTSQTSSTVTSPDEFDAMRTSLVSYQHLSQYPPSHAHNYHSTLTAFKYITPSSYHSAEQLTFANVSKLTNDVISCSSSRKRALSQSQESENAGFFSDDDVDDAHDIYSENNNETKPRKKASQAARNILMDWLVEHQNHPYPNKKQKHDLSEESGLTVKQIVHWMSNVRKRRLLPLLSGKRPAKSKVDVKFIQDIEQRRRKKGMPSLGVNIPNQRQNHQRYQGR